LKTPKRVTAKAEMSCPVYSSPIPAIMLAYMNQKGSNQFTSDVCNLALDAISIFSGVVNLAKLRYLAKVKQVSKVMKITAWSETISGTAHKNNS
jgi:hypothetical protein